MMAIYSITNRENGKMYIGSSINFHRRKYVHLTELRGKKHHSSYLQNSYNKYGESNFDFEILEDINKAEDLIPKEQYWIDTFESYDSKWGYNISPTAGSILGYKRTEESKQLISRLLKGRPKTEEHRKNLSISRMGCKLSEEHKAKINPKGRKHSEETKRKIGASHIGRIYPPTSEETKKKLSEVLTGRVISEETKKKMSIVQMGNTKALGYKHTDEAKKQISIAKQGCKNSYYNQGKPVLQYDMNGELMNEFANLVRASEATGVYPQNIGQVCRGRCKHSGGFTWKYKEEVNVLQI